MSVNPIENTSTSHPTTGSLEELFRHHLGEEATAPLRPMVWDQLDNSLLLRQNEIYRRRLTVTRWVAAASLLLATLAGTGWWTRRAASPVGPEVATSGRPAASGAGFSASGKVGAGTSTSSGGVAGTGPQASGNSKQALAAASGTTTAVPATAAPIPATGTLPTHRSRTNRSYLAASTPPLASARPAPLATRTASPPTRLGQPAVLPHLVNGVATADRYPRHEANPAQPGMTSGAVVANRAQATTTTGRSTQAASATPATASRNAGPTGTDRTASPFWAATRATVAVPAVAARANDAPFADRVAPALESSLPTASLAGSEPVSLLAARSAALALPDWAAVRPDLTTGPLPGDTESVGASAVHRWRYAVSYTAGTFNPNINFSRAGIEAPYAYNPALGANSPALTEAAAAQYRDNLRAGRSQSLGLRATRHLAGHWSLSTGVELTQATATSAASSSFVGEQVPDFGQSSAGKLNSTAFRYRLASIPVEVQYANPVKRGWSLYGRLGGVVSALLGVRSEVAGDPEATRTYSIVSSGTPYRRVLGSVRGGAGAQFRPGTSHWTLMLGPVAEIGLVSLNAHPAQDYLAQSRPYGFGVEAGVEFGR